MTGSMAATSPPGLLCQVLSPAASKTRSTGRRFAATTRSNVGATTVIDHHLPHVVFYPAYGPGLSAAMPAKQGGHVHSQTDHAPQSVTYPAKRTPQNEVTLAKAESPEGCCSWPEPMKYPGVRVHGGRRP